jgi:DNA-binding FadR family transcriptional regulator
MEDRIVRRKLSDEVLDRLLSMIERRELAPGDALPAERELAGRFGVGRPAVRQALQALEQLGLVQIQQGERSRLLAPTTSPVFEQFDRNVRHLLKASPETREHFRDARLVFETGVVRLAAERATEDNLREMEAALAEQRRSVGDPARFIRADVAFHRALAAATHNPVLAATAESLLAWIFEFYPRLLRAPGTEPLTLSEHAEIVKELRKRNADGAAHALAKHLRRTNPLYQPPKRR